jgi:hypothetical protein
MRKVLFLIPLLLSAIYATPVQLGDTLIDVPPIIGYYDPIRVYYDAQQEYMVEFLFEYSGSNNTFSFTYVTSLDPNNTVLTLPSPYDMGAPLLQTYPLLIRIRNVNTGDQVDYVATVRNYPPIINVHIIKSIYNEPIIVRTELYDDQPNNMLVLYELKVYSNNKQIFSATYTAELQPFGVHYVKFPSLKELGLYEGSEIVIVAKAIDEVNQEATYSASSPVKLVVESESTESYESNVQVIEARQAGFQVEGQQQLSGLKPSDIIILSILGIVFAILIVLLVRK